MITVWQKPYSQVPTFGVPNAKGTLISLCTQRTLTIYVFVGSGKIKQARSDMPKYYEGTQLMLPELKDILEDFICFRKDKQKVG